MSMKLTIEMLQETAAKLEGKCLSTEYVDAHTKYQWQCKEGHVWWACACNVRLGYWCPQCNRGGRKPTLTLSDLRAVARQHNGKCLAKKAERAEDKYLWCCAKGHEWEASYANVYHKGSWCPFCWRMRIAPKGERPVPRKGKHGRRGITLEHLRAAALRRSGECLSETVGRAQDKYRWRCAKGHEWEASYANVHNHGTWCPMCREPCPQKKPQEKILPAKRRRANRLRRRRSVEQSRR